MASICAKVIIERDLDMDRDSNEVPTFDGTNLSTKLKHLGCGVVSFSKNQSPVDDPDISYLGRMNL